MPELTLPTPRLRDAWLAAREEWGRGAHQHGSGLTADDDVDTPDGFRAWVERLARESDPSVVPTPGRVHATSWWIVEGDAVLGAIQLRHELNDFLLEAGGHIGYGVRPTARRRRHASWALGEALVRAGALGLDRVLLTCDDDNLASRRTIERSGGVLEDVRDTAIGRKRRYWIAV